MANLDSRIVIAGKTPNVDYKYGPYVGTPESVHNTLATYQYNEEGLTVGIKSTANSPIKEYWYVGGIQLENLVPKQSEVPEQVQSDWNESDTSDPAYIKNKPTISDGGQGSVQIPLSGNVKVTASTASGDTAGVTVTQGQTAGEIEMQFTLPKGADGVNGTNGTNGINGKSAYQQWLDEGNTGDETDFLNSLKAQIGKFIYSGYNATAAALAIGGTTTEALATGATDDSIVLMPNNDATAGTGNPTATMMFCVSVSDDPTPVTTYTYIGDVNVDASAFIGKDKIVNNLNTGGTDKVLSAEAGATLNRQINGGTVETIIGTKTNPPTWSGKYVNNSGELITDESQFKLTNPIRLNKGETIHVVQRYSPMYGSIFLVNEELTSATRVANIETNAAYMASSDCYVSAHINDSASATYTITKISPTIGITEEIGDLSELQTTNKSSLVEAINEVKNQNPTITIDDEPIQGSSNPISSNGVYGSLHGKTYIPEYELYAGNWNANNTEWVGGAQYKHTSAIAVSKGDSVKVYNQYNTQARMLWKADSEGTPTQNLSGTQNYGTLTWLSTEDCYVVADFNTAGSYYIKITPKGLVETVEDNTDAITALTEDVSGLNNSVNDNEKTLVLDTDYRWIAGSYTNHTITGLYRTYPIHLNAGDTIICETRYNPNNSPSIAAVPNDSDNASYNTSVITEISERFDKGGVSWYRRTFTAKYDMYVTCSAQSPSNANAVIKIISGTLHNIENKIAYEQEKNVAFQYLPDSYKAMRRDIESRINIQEDSLYRNAMKERQVMISEVAQMDKEDSEANIPEYSSSFYKKVGQKYKSLQCDAAYWKTNYHQFYEREQVSGNSAPEWKQDTYYKLIGDEYVTDEQEPQTWNENYTTYSTFKQLKRVTHLLTEGKCGYMPGSNFATDPTDFVDDTIHWKLYDNGILYISGYGRMYDFVKGPSGCRTKAQIDHNFPLSGEMWYYNMPVNGVEYTYSDGNKVTYQGKKFFDQTFGDSINPLNNKPYGYAAPWYIYRAETDMVSYVTPTTYYANNPQKWVYDRICIVEDTTNNRGGITYIGNWNFYRNTAQYLMLPEHAEKIGAYGVRYSTTMKYLYMGDSVTEIEDHGISRNEALESIRFSSALSNVWLNGLQSNICLYAVSLRSQLITVGNRLLYANPNTVYINLNGIKSISPSCINGVTGNSHLLFAYIGEGCESIASSAFTTNSNLIELTIPSTCLTIGQSAFSGCTSLKYVTINSPAIAASVSTVLTGTIFRTAEILRIKNTITDTGGIEAFFSYVGEKDGYKYYIRIRK